MGRSASVAARVSQSPMKADNWVFKLACPRGRGPRPFGGFSAKKADGSRKPSQNGGTNHVAPHGKMLPVSLPVIRRRQRGSKRTGGSARHKRISLAPSFL